LRSQNLFDFRRFIPFTIRPLEAAEKQILFHSPMYDVALQTLTNIRQIAPHSISISTRKILPIFKKN